jgi:hypothetical protein
MSVSANRSTDFHFQLPMQDKERAVLPPVQAVSSVAAPVAQIGVAESLENPSATPVEPDAAVALSMGVSAGVEGKLNMLLLATRERMIDSLFAVIDAVSAALDTTRQPDETTTEFAVRLADAMTKLTPGELGDVQQQVSAEVKMPPLSLIAQAFRDPAGAAAVQVVAYLEVSSYGESDLATQTVVDSYGLNDGNAELPVSASLLKPGPALTPDLGQSSSQASVLVPGQLNPSADSAPLQPAPLSVAVEISAAPVSVPVQQIEAAGRTVPPAQPTEAGQSIEPDQVPVPRNSTETVNEAPKISAVTVGLAADPTRLMNANPTQAAQAFAPRQVQQVKADIQDGLKVVVNLVIDSAGPELLQIMEQGKPLADRVLAEALVSDMADGIELQTPPAAIGADGKASAPVAESTAALQPIPVDSDMHTSALPSRPTDATATPSVVPLAAAQMQAMAAPIVGVPFAIAQYLPASVVDDDREDIFIDRVDPVDGEKHGSGQADDQDAEEEQAETAGDEPKQEPSKQALTPGPIDGGSDAAIRPDRPSAGTEGSPPASPDPAPFSSLQDNAHERYRRMVGWE